MGRDGTDKTKHEMWRQELTLNVVCRRLSLEFLVCAEQVVSMSDPRNTQFSEVVYILMHPDRIVEEGV